MVVSIASQLVRLYKQYIEVVGLDNIHPGICFYHNGLQGDHRKNVDTVEIDFGERLNCFK